AGLNASVEDVVVCHGNRDENCIAGGDDNYLERMHGRLHGEEEAVEDVTGRRATGSGLPSRLKLWQLFFAHRDYFWRLGLCVPGGDPADWGREKYGTALSDEL